MAEEVFANNPVTTVLSGGTAAPSAGTSETWTVADTSLFPAASSSGSPATQFHVADPALPDEIVAVTSVSGNTWTVTRGAEATTPAEHAASFTITQVVSAGAFGAFAQAAQVTAAIATAGESLLPLPSGTPDVGQVPVVTVASPLALDWDVPASTGVQLGGDIGGTDDAPEVLKIQGIAITAPTGTATEYLDATGGWSTPASGSGGVQIGGDLSGTDAAPTVAKIQGTAITAPSGGTTHFLNADGTWTAPAGGGDAFGGGILTEFIAPSVVALTDAATITVNASAGNDFRVTLAGNRTMGAPSDPTDGQSITFEVASAGHSLAWNAAYGFGTGTAPDLTTTGTYVIGFRYSTAATAWLYLGCQGPF